MPSGLSTLNKFFVGGRVGDDQVILLRPVPQSLSPDDAIILAAWLVAIADPAGERFQEYLQEVLGT